MNIKYYSKTYKSGITKEQCISMITNRKISNDNALIVIKCFLETREDTCKELAINV